VPRCIQFATHGFHPAKLVADIIPDRPEWAIDQPPLVSDDVWKQPFTYLARGSQSYVFASEDGQYVLKLFRYNRSQFSWIHQLKRLFHRNNRKNLKVDLATKLNYTLNAAKIACITVPECTQVVWAHLTNSRCHDNARLTVIDRLGRPWTLRLSHYRFVLQRRALPLKKVLAEALQTQDFVRARRLIASYQQLITTRASRGVRNSDPNFGPNSGFIDDRAIEIDFGNYRSCPELIDNPRAQAAELERFLTQLRYWILSIYREGLKNWKTGKEAVSVFQSGVSGRAQEHATNEDEKSETKPTPPGTNFSNTRGINPTDVALKRWAPAEYLELLGLEVH
jgi:hypothetical protein